MNLKKRLQRFTVLNEPYTRWKWREKKVSYGSENGDRTFFVIRRATCKAGLFSLVMTNMGLVRYALSKGYIPVIDMQFNQNTYLEPEEVGKRNSWEYYFEQPCGYTMEEVLCSKNVILSNGLITADNVYPTFSIISSRKEFEQWHSFFQKYLRIKSEIAVEAESIKNNLFHGEKVLGVLCRGTDYTEQRPKNHPVQPDIDEMIMKAEQVLQEYDCKYIYLATEDERAYRRFRTFFNDKLKVTDAKRCENVGDTNINDITYDRENDRYLRGKEYLINIILLAGCNCLVAGSAGGTYAAMLMADKYEYSFIYDLGMY